VRGKGRPAFEWPEGLRRWTDRRSGRCVVVIVRLFVPNSNNGTRPGLASTVAVDRRMPRLAPVLLQLAGIRLVVSDRRPLCGRQAEERLLAALKIGRRAIVWEGRGSGAARGSGRMRLRRADSRRRGREPAKGFASKARVETDLPVVLMPFIKQAQARRPWSRYRVLMSGRHARSPRSARFPGSELFGGGRTRTIAALPAVGGRQGGGFPTTARGFHVNHE